MIVLRSTESWFRTGRLLRHNDNDCSIFSATVCNRGGVCYRGRGTVDEDEEVEEDENENNERINTADKLPSIG
jgi:hypothetical protein